MIAALVGCGESTTTGSGVAAGTQSSPAAQTATRAQPAAGATTTTPAAANPGSVPSGRREAKLNPIARANAICAQRNQELRALPKAGSGLPALAEATSRRAAIDQRALGQLEKLTPPADVARDYATLLAFNRASLRRLAKVSHYARANDAAMVHATELAATRGELRGLFSAARAGMRSCASSG